MLINGINLKQAPSTKHKGSIFIITAIWLDNDTLHSIRFFYANRWWKRVCVCGGGSVWEGGGGHGSIAAIMAWQFFVILQ